MLHLKWKDLQNRSLIRAVEKIRDCDKIEKSAAYRAGRVTEKIASEIRIAHEKNIEILKKWAKLDDRGHLVPIPNSDGEFEFDTGKKEQYEAELRPLANTEFVVKANKIELSDISNCHLTPSEIVALVDTGILTEPT